MAPASFQLQDYRFAGAADLNPSGCQASRKNAAVA